MNGAIQLRPELNLTAVHFGVSGSGPEPGTGDPVPVTRPADQADNVGPLVEAHIRERGDPTADSPVDQFAARGKHQEVAGKPDIPTVGVQPGDIAGRVERGRAGPHQLPGQARQQPLHPSAAAFQQGVHVAALRQSFTGGRGLGEAVSLHQRDAVEVVR